MTHRVSKLRGQWLFCQLSLVLVISLLLFRVVRRRFVSWLGNNKGIAASINRICLISGRRASGIALRLLSGKRRHPHPPTHKCGKKDRSATQEQGSTQRASQGARRKLWFQHRCEKPLANPNQFPCQQNLSIGTPFGVTHPDTQPRSFL